MDKRVIDLMMTFHTLAGRVGPDGTLDDLRAITRNASQSRGTQAAAAFVLHVATGSPFDRAHCWAHWDQEQRDAFAAWEAAPWLACDASDAVVAAPAPYPAEPTEAWLKRAGLKGN